MANIPSLVDQVKNEEDMINLSQDDLLSYYTATSSIAADALSSVSGLDNEILFYQAAVGRAESTITGLDVEIIANSGVLGGLRLDQLRLEGESTLYNEQVISTTYQIELLDSTIFGSDKTLSSLDEEYKALDYAIVSSTEGFIKEATYYSSLFDIYLTRKSEYDTNEINITQTSSLLESAILTAADSYAAWLTSYSTLSGEQSTLNNLETREINLIGLQTLAGVELTEAQYIFNSTKTSVDTHSSLYEVALITRDYIRYLSSEQEAVEALAEAQELFTQAQAQYQASQTTGNLTIMNNAQQVLTNMQQKRDAYTIQSGTRIDYSTILGNVGTVAYETLIRGYNTDIAFEQSTIEQYTKLSNYAVQYLEPFYRLQRDSSLSNEAMYLNESTFWGEKYVSSLAGYDSLIKLEAQLTTQINENSNAVILLDEDIEGTLFVKTRYPQQDGTIYDSARPRVTYGLRQEVEDLTSSFVNYSTISSINTILAIQSDALIAQYNDQYLSIGNVIAGLEIQRDNTTSSISGYQLESSITINQMNYLTIQMAKEDIEMFIAFNDIERAAFQYRESYVRGERIRRQNEYEGLVSDAIKEASNRAVATGQSNFMDLVNLDTPAVNSAYNTFQNLTNLLSEFDTLDGSYETRGTRLSNLRTEYVRYVSLNNDLVTLLSEKARNPLNTAVDAQITTKRGEITAKQGTVTTNSNDVNSATATVNSQKISVMSKFVTYFSPAMIDQIGTSISSFITAGYNTGYAQASLA
jgi:hypothetical protein